MSRSREEAAARERRGSAAPGTAGLSGDGSGRRRAGGHLGAGRAALPCRKMADAGGGAARLPRQRGAAGRGEESGAGPCRRRRRFPLTAPRTAPAWCPQPRCHASLLLCWDAAGPISANTGCLRRASLQEDVFLLCCCFSWFLQFLALPPPLALALPARPSDVCQAFWNCRLQGYVKQ